MLTYVAWWRRDSDGLGRGSTILRHVHGVDVRQVNSAGTLLSSPIFGYWSDKRNFGEVLAVSLAIGVVANVTYAVSYATWMLLIARFLVGFGNGTLLCAFRPYCR